MSRLEGKAAIVTGAGEGIGRHIALAFAQAGASVTAVDIKEAGIHETARMIESESGEGRVIPLPLDIGDREGMNRAIEACIRRFERLDCIVNNAANQSAGWLEEITEEHWDAVQSVNVKAALWFAQTGLPHLERNGGSIVNISSLVADMAMPGRLAYCTSKAALLGLTRSLAVDLGRRGIRVNAICPGHIMSFGEERWKADRDPDEQRVMQSSYALGRCGRPEEVAAAAVFLASDDASFITGEALNVDGGMGILNPESSVHRAAEIFGHPPRD
ncbi:MAG: SDR family oxidoreductase [Armatimonadetes bacterium]|nr:SDR family oxidoreductase [Armatimonadota bacterium]